MAIIFSRWAGVGALAHLVKTVACRDALLELAYAYRVG
jgi:hypothetical protein